MKMVPMVYSHHVALASMDWLPPACGGPELITCDIWQPKQASWEVYATKDGNLPVADSPPTILMRVGGVSRCLNFGVEVEMLNQHFSNAFPEHPAGVLPRQFLDQTAGAHVIVWTEVRG